MINQRHKSIIYEISIGRMALNQITSDFLHLVNYRPTIRYVVPLSPQTFSRTHTYRTHASQHSLTVFFVTSFPLEYATLYFFVS